MIVTGGAGYIGSHACKALRNSGYRPITVDNLSTGWSEAVKFGPFEQVDLLDQVRLGQIFEMYKPHAVMHFAAFSQVGESVEDPAKYWRNNVMGSLNLFQTSAEYGCKRIIFSSTCATYGDQDNVILNEYSQQVPNNAYGASKLAVEQMLNHFERAYGLSSVILRYFNVAGADPDAELGEVHNPETHLIPIILEVINGKRDALTIFGTDYDTPDGTCIRDYVHVCDLVDAHVLSLNWLLDGKGSRVFNLGTGVGFSVRDVIECAKVITQKEVPIVLGHRRIGDCAKLVSGSARAMEELNWSYERSNLTQMITDALRWHKYGGYKE